MKDEIKEIIEDYSCIPRIKKLGDYITNLQEELEEQKRIEQADFKTIQNLEEENERLKELLQQEKKDFKEANDYCFELKDYKSRCEKAIPMLKELNKKLKDILNTGIDIAEITDIENTLTGGDKE